MKSDHPDRRTVDRLLGEADEPARLEVRLIRDDEDEAFDVALISAPREGLRLLASVLLALADSDELPAKVQIGPRAAGSVHFLESSLIGLYLQCEEG